MKLLKTISLILLSLSTQSLYAANSICSDDHGVMYCAEGEIDSIHHLGKTYLASTRVNGQVWIMGNLDANHADMGVLSVIGNIESRDSIVRGVTEATGNVRADQSQFQANSNITGDVIGGGNTFSGEVKIIGTATLNHDVFTKALDLTGKLKADYAHFNSQFYLTACEATFYHSMLTTLTVNAQPRCPENTQKIYLYDKSQVKGDIVFRGGNGKVFISKDSAVTGRIIGGSVVSE